MASHPTTRPPLPLAVLGALFLVSLALRPQLVGLGPLLPQIQDELGVSHAVVGLLTTIPVLCMGLFAPLGPVIAARYGTRRTLAVCVSGIIIFGLLRSAVPNTIAVVATTLGLGLAMGTAGALMSIVVKERAPSRPALATGVYATGIVAGSLVAAAAAVPLAVALGGWRAAMAVMSIAAIGSLVGWLALLPRDPATARTERVAAPALPWRSGLAWGLAAVFGLQSLLYYGTISWLPDVYVERGWSEASAGSLIALLHLVGLAIGLVVPWAADRVGSRRSQLATVATVALVGYLGISLVPDAGWLWAVFLGFGLGAVFPLCLTLPVDVAHRPAEVGAVAAFMLLGGYLIAGFGPVVLGLVRDATGDFGAMIWLLVALSAVLVAACLALTPTRLQRGIASAASGVASEPA